MHGMGGSNAGRNSTRKDRSWGTYCFYQTTTTHMFGIRRKIIIYVVAGNLWTKRKYEVCNIIYQFVALKQASHQWNSRSYGLINGVRWPCTKVCENCIIIYVTLLLLFAMIKSRWWKWKLVSVLTFIWKKCLKLPMF